MNDSKSTIGFAIFVIIIAVSKAHVFDVTKFGARPGAEISKVSLNAKMLLLLLLMLIFIPCIMPLQSISRLWMLHGRLHVTHQNIAN